MTKAHTQSAPLFSKAGGASDSGGIPPTDRPSPLGNPVAELQHVDVLYDAHHGSESRRALSDISLSIHAGEHVCILGANGSGKTTLGCLLSALTAPTEGTARVFGMDPSVPSDALRIRRRVATVFQNPDDQMVTSIVEDDVAFGPENLGVPPAEIRRRVDASLRAVDMAGFAKADPADLSGGQRQRVAIAGALAMAPDLLVLDEPSAMLDARGHAEVSRIVDGLSSRGITIVHITHFMDDAMRAGRVVVLDSGRVVLDGTPAEVFSHADELIEMGLDLPFPLKLARELRADPAFHDLAFELRDESLAEAIAKRLPSAARPPAVAASDGPGEAGGNGAREGGTDAVRFDAVSFSYVGQRDPRRPSRRRRVAEGPLAIRDVTLSIGAGTVTALVGNSGAGKSTLAELACALKLPRSGRVVTCGIATDDFSRRRELRSSIGYVAQSPERQLFAETVYDDVAFGPRNLGLSEDEVRRRVERSLAMLGLPPSRDLLGRSPFSLSGGQQRSVAIAGVLALEAPAIVLDEPMAGLDPSGRERMKGLMRALAARGVSMLVVTHSMDDAAEMAGSIVLIDKGRVLAQGSPASVFLGEHADGLPGRPRALDMASALRSRGIDLPVPPLTLSSLVEGILEEAHRGDSR